MPELDYQDVDAEDVSLVIDRERVAFLALNQLLEDLHRWVIALVLTQ